MTTPRKRPRRLTYHFALLFFADDSIPGCWVAFALDIGVVTQGESLAHAVYMVKEAMAMYIAWHAARGQDPFRIRGEDNHWQKFRRIILHGRPARDFPTAESGVRQVAVLATCSSLVDGSGDMLESAELRQPLIWWR